jgi:hypothetical protein
MWSTIAAASVGPGWLTLRRTPDGGTTTTACPGMLVQRTETGTSRCVFAVADKGLITAALDDPSYIDTVWRRT